MQLAVFEAVNSITGEYQPYLGTITAKPDASPEAAAIEAAYQVLNFYFPNSASALLTAYTNSLAQIPDGQAKSDGIAAGDAAAAAMIALRSNDGSSPPQFAVPGPPAPGVWQATPSCPMLNGVAVGIAFQWPYVTPFGIPSASDFLLGPPPALTSNQYTKTYNEVMTVGSTNAPSDRQIAQTSLFSMRLPVLRSSVSCGGAHRQVQNRAPSYLAPESRPARPYEAADHLRHKLRRLTVTSVASSEVVRLREASFADYSQIAAVETRNGLLAKSVAEWEHIWVNNPAFQGVEGKWPIGWVLQDQDDRVVGSFGNFPLLLELKGRRLLAASGRAWAVDPRYRGYSILLLDHFLNQKNVALFLNTTANLEASTAFTAFQAIRVPVGNWDESIFWITEYRGFVESLLRRKSTPMAALAAYPASKMCSLLDTVRGQNLHRAPSGPNLASCSAFDGRFDDFWRRLQKASPRLLSVRTSEVLNWHFKYTIERKELLILTAEDRDGLEAYAILGRQDNRKIGLRRVALFDFQCLSASAPTIFMLMIRYALARCVEDRVHMLELTGLRPDYAAAAEQLSPHRRKLSSWRYLYKTNDAELAEVLHDPAAWDASFYDGDASI